MYARFSVLALVLAWGPGPMAALAGPNVLLIIGDDQAWGDFGFMGHPAIETPSLDRLASQSLVFTRGYVPSSLCRPSLATLATGLYPNQHKITGTVIFSLSYTANAYFAKCRFSPRTQFPRVIS